jgi:ABC-type transport system involved in multi-copper enzyme maturation permease subunit
MPRFFLPGPLFALEMTSSARRARYFVTRVVYGAIILIALFNVYQSYDIRSYPYNSLSDIALAAQYSWTFFSVFSFLQVLAVVVAGPAMAAGTIASEREHRTIEYLFASTLTNAEIIFGKLLARLMQLGYLVLAGMPILFIAMLMGGIAPEAIVVLTIVTLSTALTVSIVSITISVWTARARDAVMRAYLVLIIALILPPLISVLPMMIGLRAMPWFFDVIRPGVDQLIIANPFGVLGATLVTASSANTAAAWTTLLALVRNQAIICLGCITAATLAVRRVHLRAQGSTPKKRRRRVRLFRPALGDRPMLWKEIVADPAALRKGIAWRIAVVLVIAAILTPTIIMFWTSATTYGTQQWRGYPVNHQDYLTYCMFMGALTGSGALFLIAARAAGLITAEKERDSWTSLISTPLEAREIVLGKIAGNLWAARGAVIMLAAIWGLGALLEPGFGIAVVFAMGTFLLLAAYASALGVIYSLWCRTSMRAIIATLATGIFAGGGYLFCCIPLMMTMRGDEGIIVLAGCIPFLLACPPMCYVEKPPGAALTAYVFGMMGYFVAMAALVVSAIGSFDRFTGRTREVPRDVSMQGADGPRAAVQTRGGAQTKQPLKLAQGPIMAEIVEEP